jgi:hypothetical protein
VAYRADVGFLAEAEAGLIARNADEFARVRDVLAVAGERADFVALAGSFARASRALTDYAGAVAEAKGFFDAGVDAEDRLDELISAASTPVTRAAQEAEPMRRWEEMQGTEGFLAWLSEIGGDIEGIRAEAERAYDQAGSAFGRAAAVEKAARAKCLAGLSDTAGPADGAPAADHPAPRLPGSWPKRRAFPATGGEPVSPALAELRGKIAALPALETRFVVLGASEEERVEWLAASAEILRAAAADSGLPLDLLTAIAWKEVGRKPALLDDIAGGLRHAASNAWSPITPENLPGPLGGDRDRTSYGPLSVQVRRAAEVLGYDPATLSEEQREEILATLKDPAGGIFIAAKHVANLKASTGFAAVEPGEWTRAHHRELAARYNGGPYWEGGQAQGYAEDVVAQLDGAADS